MGVSYTAGTVDVFLTQHQYVMILDTIAVMIDVIGTLTATLTPPTNDASTAASGQLQSLLAIGHDVAVATIYANKTAYWYDYYCTSSVFIYMYCYTR